MAPAPILQRGSINVGNWYDPKTNFHGRGELGFRRPCHSLGLYPYIFAVGSGHCILATLIFVNVGIVQLRIQALRRRGIYPAKGRATTADVERLLKAGHRIWAIRCYREIHDVELATAKAAVETLRVSG
jgi:hypothetical protein